MFKQTEFKGYDNKAMDKDYKKMVKQYKRLGFTDERASRAARGMVEYYAHTYRVYS